MRAHARAAAFVASAATFVAAVWFSPKEVPRAQAMPPFAQAYGVSCSLCHTQVPALNAYGRYIQRDPVNGVPGVLAMYQVAYDANPGMGLLPAASTAGTLELYEPVLDKGLVSVREEWTNDGLGDRLQTGNIDFSYQFLPFLHAYVEDAISQYSVPEWRYMVWLTVPLRNLEPQAAPALTATPK